MEYKGSRPGIESNRDFEKTVSAERFKDDYIGKPPDDPVLEFYQDSKDVFPVPIKGEIYDKEDRYTKEQMITYMKKVVAEIKVKNKKHIDKLIWLYEDSYIFIVMDMAVREYQVNVIRNIPVGKSIF